MVQDDIPWAYAGAIIDKHNEQMLDVLGMIGRMSEFVGNIDPSIMDAFVFGENIRAQDIYHDEQASAGTHLYDEHCLRCNKLHGSATLVEPNTQED